MKTDSEQTYSMFFEDGLYIGDPCYVLKDDFYRKVWEQKHNFAEGNIEGKMVVYHTEFGDGTVSLNGVALDVDSGNIAFVPLYDTNICRLPESARGIWVCSGTGCFSVYRKDGILYARIMQEQYFELCLK